MKNPKKGFTLIELLVVIAIIGLLATLSVVALNNARERARDSRRVSDVKQIQTALELYYNAHNGYPTKATKGDAADISSDLIAFIDPLPENPLPDDCSVDWDDKYQYKSDDGDEYELDYCLGNATGGIPAGLNTANEMTITSSN